MSKRLMLATFIAPALMIGLASCTSSKAPGKAAQTAASSQSSAQSQGSHPPSSHEGVEGAMVLSGVGQGVPIPADYDGDGAADIAVYQEDASQAHWSYRSSRTGQIVTRQIPLFPYDHRIQGKNFVLPIRNYRGDGRAWLAQIERVPRQDPLAPECYNVVYANQPNWCFGQLVWHLYSPDPAVPARAIYWGNGTDMFLSADFDGDGRGDLVAVRPIVTDRYTDCGQFCTVRATRWQYRWWILHGNGSTETFEWGQNYVGQLLSTYTISDLPIVGDFNGDHRADATVVRQDTRLTTDTWINQLSGGGVRNTPFGRENVGFNSICDGHYPESIYGNVCPQGFTQAADLDGDGKSDLIVVQRGDTLPPLQACGGTNQLNWNILKSSTGQARLGIRWGIVHYPCAGYGAPDQKDIPVPADYDGDGIEDIAVYRSSDQNWYILIDRHL